jgi:hypothetical protein
MVEVGEPATNTGMVVDEMFNFRDISSVLTSSLLLGKHCIEHLVGKVILRFLGPSPRLASSLVAQADAH